MRHVADEDGRQIEQVEKWLKLDKLELISLFGSQLPVQTNMEGQHTGPPKSSIFLSYARADEAIVGALYDGLRDSGFSPWMDIRDIYPGEDWAVAINSAIERSDFFILCLSQNSVGHRGFLQREIKKALDRLLDFLEDDIFFVPVRLTDCERPKQIMKKQTVDLFEPSGYSKLLGALMEGIERRRNLAG